MKEHRYWVYIMASESGTLYLGMTGNLEGRVRDHKEGRLEGFSKKYDCHKLLWFEEGQYVNDIIAREKKIKKWSRKKKCELIKEMNPTWKDLAEDW